MAKYKDPRDDIEYQEWIIKLFPELINGDTIINDPDSLNSKVAGSDNWADTMDAANIRRNVCRSVTFQVTDACNLCCSYCYQINKGHRRMSFETAKKLIDQMLDKNSSVSAYLGNCSSVILDFIGGEPLLEIELVDQIIEYFTMRCLEMGHIWADTAMFSLCTNGVLYRDPQVQKFLAKYKNRLSLNVTVDGTKELHDSCRVFSDGRGSYNLAHDAATDWIKKGNEMGSKITLAPSNIKYFTDCFKAMLADGYNSLHANFVFEDVWNPVVDAPEIYRQSKAFIDWFYENGFEADKYKFSFFSEGAGRPTPEENNENYCGGTGNMLAMDPDGKLYPCLRFMESSVGTKIKPFVIGDVYEGGIAYNKCTHDCLNCLEGVTRRSQSTDKCFYCPISSECGWCSAYNYQSQGTVDKRATYICEMHQARILATVYYWNTYYKKHPELHRVKDLWVPKEWALRIINKEEYSMLASLTESLGGFVNQKTEIHNFDLKREHLDNKGVYHE